MQILRETGGSLLSEIQHLLHRTQAKLKMLPLDRILSYYIYIVWILIALVCLALVLLIPLWIIVSPILLLAGLVIYTISITPYKFGNALHKVYLQFYDWLFYRSQYPKKILWRFIYDSMCLFYPQSKWRSMNYGYAVLNENGLTLNYDGPDKDEIFCFQLYHFVASNQNQQKDLKGQTVLEIGCGRGGGLNFLARTMQPAKCIGIDISDQQVQFCQTNYASNKTLEFLQSDAETFCSKYPGLQGQVDIVINVESSHCYSNFRRFVEEVTLALKNGGMFYITDFREISQIEELEEDLASSGLKFIKKENISIQVLHALKLDEKRKLDWINNHTPYLIRPFFRKFSGMKDTRIFKELQQKKTVYMAYSLQKQ